MLQSGRWTSPIWTNVWPPSLGFKYPSILKMEAARSSEMLVPICQTILSNNPTAPVKTLDLTNIHSDNYNLR
jgi:hypothetical protein